MLLEMMRPIGFEQVYHWCALFAAWVRVHYSLPRCFPDTTQCHLHPGRGQHLRCVWKQLRLWLAMYV